MATPRINRVFAYGEDPDSLPATGPCGGGQVVVITGAGFLRPSLAGYLATVRVRFGDATSPLVRVLRGNMLHATTPATPLGIEVGGEGLVDVEVANLDEDGIPIPGEVATATGAYQYRLPRLDSGQDQAVAEVERALIIWLSTRVCANSLSGQSVEYDDSDVAIVPEIAKLPAIVISGPDVASPMFPRENRVLLPGFVLDPEGRAQVMRHTVQVDLLYRVTGQAAGRAAMLNLMSALMSEIDRAQSITVPTERSEVRMDLGFDGDGRPRGDMRPSDSDLHSFTARIRVSNVLVVGIRPHPGSEVDVAVPLVQEIVVETDPA